MSLAYLLGKGSSKALHTKINIPILLVLSILPDTDIIYDLFTGASIHRGPTHSIVVAFLVFIPVFIYLGKRAVPYFLALISHSLLADFFIGGDLQLLWPLSGNVFGFHELGGAYIGILSSINIVTEMLLFVFAMLVLYRSGDWKVFFKADKTNLVLIIPIVTVLLPSTIGYPFSESLLLLEPTLAIAHLIYLALFAIATLKTMYWMYTRHFGSAKTQQVPVQR
jgi:membrane-bound metal-dependent hydrolase YbcI (DUF457 family)